MRSQVDIAGDCLGPDTLAGFVEGRADAVARARVEDHASRCDACREVLSSLARDGTPPVAPPIADDELAPGTLLGRYVIARPIGAGGMGVVYAAHDPELDRTVAVKLLRGDGDPDQRERLRREAQAMAKLAHPHVIAVHDAGAIGDRMFIAMELVEGETLAQWLRQPRTVDDILEAYRAAGRGLAAAHEVGIVHRDVKPENILVGKDGRVRIGDFGLARDGAGRPAIAAGSPASGGLHGTPSYMAPELYRGGVADERSDQFSFCVALFTALYGERPFAGETLAALIAHLQAGELRTPRNARRVPRRVRAAIERGLAHEPSARFGSLRALLDELAPRDRRARWIAASAALVGAATLATIVIAPRVAAPAPCAQASEAFAASWNPMRRAGLAAAFVATGAPGAAAEARRVGDLLDGYATRWADGYGAACRATRVIGAQSEALLDLRMTCLERRRQETGALVSTLAAATRDTVEHAATGALGLIDVAGCADVAALQQRVAPPADPVTRARLAVLSAHYARVRAAYQTGAYRVAREPARTLAVEAHQLGYLPFTAEAALLEGLVARALGEGPAEHAALDAALWAAEAGRHDEVAAEAWIRIIRLIGYIESDFSKALALVPRATAAIARLGNADEWRARLEIALGAIDYKQGKLASAAAHETAGLALSERSLAPGHLELGRALEDLGTTAAQQGELERGIRLLERARQIYEAALGPDHPLVANVLHNLGAAHLRRDDLAAAESELRRAQVIREALDPEHPNLAGTLTALGATLARRGQLAEALALHRRAVAIADKAWGPDGLDLIAPLLYQAISVGQANDVASAIAIFDRAEAIAAKALGPAHPYTMLALLGKADLLSDQAQWTAAVALYERVIPVLAHAEGAEEDRDAARARLGRAYLELAQPARALVAIAPLREALAALRAETRAEVELTIARATWPQPAERARARELAARAVIDFRASVSPRVRADAARAERWLADHPASERAAAPGAGGTNVASGGRTSR